jgi:hypothetical protein
LVPSNEGTEPIPPFDTIQATNKQPAQSKYWREFKPNKRYTYSIWKLTAKSSTKADFVEYNEEEKTQSLENPILLTRKSSTDMDTLYLHKALKAPDSQKLKEAMLEEIEQHIQKKN